MKLYSYRWDWPLAGLLMLLVYAAAARLSVTGWTPDLWSVEGLAVLGSLLGLALGVSHFQKKTVRWLATGYSLVSLPWMLTRLVSGESTALGQLASVAGRLTATLGVFWRGERVTDAIFFIAQMCTLFWFIGLFSGFQIMRQPGALGAILPSTLPLLVIQYYDGYQPQRLWMTAFYFLIALLIIGRINLLKNRENWKNRRVLAGGEPEFDISRGLFLTALLIVLAAFSAPTPAAAIPAVAQAWQTVSRPFEKVHARLNDMLAALQGGVRYVPGELYGSIMTLGRSARQGAAEIFTVKPTTSSTQRSYWRVRIYDHYENGRWSISETQTTAYDPDPPRLLNSPAGSLAPLEYIINWKTAPTALVVTPANPLWLSRSGAFQANPLRQEGYDLLSWQAAPGLQAGDQYRVRAAAFNPSLKELRAAGHDYPAWVTARYLQLPANLSEGIRRLSAQLTRDQPTNYDQAAAITTYLRENITYDLTISAPPPGIDPLDWFLFTWKSGFCNYYASAEVLLLRAAGLPARLVVGYAPGTYQPDGSYRISARDAHAWPEVYFSEIGWVEFEPTSNQAAIFRPSGTDRPPAIDDDRLSAAERLARTIGSEEDLAAKETDPAARSGASTNNGFNSPWRWLWIIIFSTLIAAMLLLVWQLERRKAFSRKLPRMVRQLYLRYNPNPPAWLERWVRWNDISAVERAFHAINQGLGWLGHPQPPDSTALERAARLKQLLPSATAAIDLLTAAHEQTLYTPEPADPAAARRAARKIRSTALHTIIRRPRNGEPPHE